MQLSSTYTLLKRRNKSKRDKVEMSDYCLNEAFYTLELLERLYQEWQHYNGLVIAQRNAIKKLEYYRDMCIDALAWSENDDAWVKTRLKRYSRHLEHLQLQTELSKTHYDKMHSQFKKQLKNIKDNH